jgi:hypothetical protein
MMACGIWLRRTVVGLVIVLLAGAGPVAAGDRSLVRFDRAPGVDRNTLLAMEVVLVAETNDSWLAVGDPKVISRAVDPLSLDAETIVAIHDDDRFALIGPRSDLAADALSVCGRQIASGAGWRLVLGEHEFSTECLESPAWFFRRLDLDPMLPERSPPTRWTGLADGTDAIVPDPLVQAMIDTIDTDVALSHWRALSESPTWTTRYSRSQGCFDAADYVHDLFTVLGLDAEYQHHTTDYADNVIGTLTGVTQPDQVYIAIAHLDDLPSTGPAPGANDNASGTAMVTAAAEAMAGYCFESTVKFIAVTGEEQGLHGSDHYADLAAATGENIQAVLNGDMIGWQGDTPASEDLDVIYNSTSAWLAQAMIDAAAGYGSGMTINGLDCPGMSSSDHWPFWQNGYSALCGITDDEGLCGSGGNYPYYHQSSDTIANCGPGGPGFEAAAIRTYLATLAHLAQPVARIPDPPVNLAAQPDGANRIALSWTPQTLGSDNLVYRSTGSCAAPGPPVLVGQTDLSSFVDTSASGGVPYAYTVIASAAVGCNSAVSDCVEATTTGTCTEPPSFEGIASVTNPAMSNCRLDLSWSPPQQVWCGGPVAYNVYRSTTAGFTPDPGNRIAGQIPATSFADHDVMYDVDYHYIVRAVDLSHGGEDGNTHEIAGHPTGPTVVGSWTDDAGDSGDAKLILEAPWTVAAGAGVTGAAYATGHYTNNLCAAVTTPALTLSVNPQLTFWSRYDIETGWDKGLVQISTDGGTTWQRVPVNYPATVTRTNDACDLGTGQFFNGTAGAWGEFSASLDDWANQEFLLQWIFSSDGWTTGDGWWIDDISITDVAVPSYCIGADLIFADGFETGTTSSWNL